MKITILGSGGFNYPLTFCECEYCSKARVLKGKNIRKRASILIDDKILVDFTPDTNNAMNTYDKDMSKVEILLQTHTHTDHFDINLFNTFAPMYSVKHTTKINLIASTLCLEDIQNKASCFDKIDIFDKEFQKVAKLNPIALNIGEEICIKNYIIKAIKTTHHDKIGAQLYLIKKDNKTIFYATDTPPFTEETYIQLSNEKIDLILLDQNFGTKDYTYSHLNINAIENIIKELSNRKVIDNNTKIFATHISHEGNPCHEELELITKEKGWLISYDGQEINL